MSKTTRATSVGSRSVLARVMVVKSAKRTLIDTVRPTWSVARSRAAVRSASRSSSRRTTAGSSTSRANVSSAPMLLSGSCALTRRSSRPQASADRCAPAAGPRARLSVVAGVCAMSPMVRSPSRVSASSVRSPTPHNAPTGSGWRNSTVASRGTTSSPSGLARADASLATNFVAATPTEQVMPCSSTTRARISSPIARAPPRRRRAPPTSRNASSRASGSTSGVTDRKISITPRDASA